VEAVFLMQIPCGYPKYDQGLRGVSITYLDEKAPEKNTLTFKEA